MAIFIVENSGKVSYGIKRYICKTMEDIPVEVNGEEIAPGSRIYVTDEKKTYMLNTAGQWVEITEGGGGGGASALGDLTDVDLGELADGEYLVYDAESGMWKNGTGKDIYVEIQGVLSAGETTITLTSEYITTNSVIEDFVGDAFDGVEYTFREVANGSVTYTFPEQSNDMPVMARIWIKGVGTVGVAIKDDETNLDSTWSSTKIALELEKKVNKTEFADEYDNTSSYSEGDITIYNNQYYINITAIPEPGEEFDPTKWQEISLSDILANIDDKMNKVNPTGSGSFSLNRKAGSEIGTYSFAEGLNTIASGSDSHAEGSNTIASGSNSHAEGSGTKATGLYAHAEGSTSTASAIYSHAEGQNTTASGAGSHSEGMNTKAIANYTHTENYETEAKGESSHAEGHQSKTTEEAVAGHAEGYDSIASGTNGSHAEGYGSKAKGGASHAENNSVAEGQYSHSEGSSATTGQYSHAEGRNTQATASAAHSEGAGTTASGENAHAEGSGATASGANSHAEGLGGNASGISSHKEGNGTSAVGDYSHAEGNYTNARGNNSHSEGSGTTATGTESHAEGAGSQAVGNQSHAEGAGSVASGLQAHAEGGGSLANGAQSHAEGSGTQAVGDYSHTEGLGTIAASQSQHAGGKYNISDDDDTYAEIIGNGEDNDHRSNARTLDWNGNETLAGDLIINGNQSVADALNNIPSITIIPGTLSAGDTTITISNTAITANSIIIPCVDEAFTGVAPTGQVTVAGSVTLTFPVQSTNMPVKVVVI